MPFNATEKKRQYWNIENGWMKMNSFMRKQKRKTDKEKLQKISNERKQA